MKEFKFTIHGNQEHESGNPIPKLHKAIRQHLTPEAKRYVGWKSHVQDAFLNSLAGIDYLSQVRIMRVFKKPIHLFTEEKAVMDIKIFWRDGYHGGPENVFASIADALFYTDKHLDGSFASEMSPTQRGIVEVTIIINES